MRNKILIFIELVAHKNQLQTEAIVKSGFQPLFFVTRFNESADTFLKGKAGQTVLEDTFFKRYRQVRSCLKKNKLNIHHIEVYPGGRFSFLYILISKIYRIPAICVERGDLLYYHKNGYSKMVRFSMWYCYRYATLIWYREPYMEPILEKLNKNLFFLHNAVKYPSPETRTALSQKDITFLWLNRVIPERRYDWFIDVLNKPFFQNTLNYLVGITPASLYKKEQHYVEENKPANLQVAGYTGTPVEFYKRAKFFVLPADVVFANHALLEAMSYGVVPLVSDQKGTRLIVDDSNGFVFEHTKTAFEAAMIKSFNISDEEYNRLSLAAIKRIKNEFSEEKYMEAIKKLYDRLYLPGPADRSANV